MSSRADASSNGAQTSQLVQRFLIEELGLEATAVEKVGAGAWSECFGFEVDGSRQIGRASCRERV